VRRSLVVSVVAALVVALAAGGWLLFGTSYTVSVTLASATNMVPGGTVQLNGFQVGSISKIQTQGDQALVTLALDRDVAPLHEGAVVTVPWKALLGERIVDITDGPASNAAIPNHGLIRGRMAKPTEIDHILNTLDPPTLEHLRSLVNQLDDTTKGHEADINTSLKAAGPALSALGGVLDALGTDGPAIRELVVRLDQLTGTFAQHQNDVRAVVTQLGRLTAQAADQQGQLRATLRELPGTLRTAQATLERVPPVADDTVPLLRDLRPATERLRPFAANLRPLMRDLRPTVRELRPTLVALSGLLDYTPDLLDSAHGTFPQLTEALDQLAGPLDFLRPYTPEAVGWLSNWNSAFAGYDANGHYARIWVQSGPGTPMPNPGLVPPGIRDDPHPLPGQNGGTPWTDAYGSHVR
jgi:phospholipid/cholesterol/gamma-HCH transport system substrate-binding protein